MIKKLYKSLTSLSILGMLLVTPVSAQAASLVFTPSTGSLNKGCEVTIDVTLDTQGIQTDGTDVIAIYNPAQLSITTAGITNGTIYSEYPGNSVDSAGGKIGMSGVSGISAPFTGSGVFAKLKFKVADTLTAGTPISLKFDFDPNNKTKTTDSNVIERGTIADVLSAVTDGNYTVGTGSCPGGVQTSIGSGTGTGTGVNGQGQAFPGSGFDASASAFPVFQPTLNDVTGGSAGLMDNTFLVAGLGIILVVLGAVGLAML